MGVCGMQEASVPPLSGGSGQARPLESCGGGLAGCALQQVLEQLSPALPGDWMVNGRGIWPVSDPLKVLQSLAL